MSKTSSSPPPLAPKPVLAPPPPLRAADAEQLAQPETIVWAKLRGYPWWPGRVKSLDSAPKELAQIARTQYKPQAVLAVYFFGSHDYSLVPADALRPFHPNWDLFSTRSSGARFRQALLEAKDPKAYARFEAGFQDPAASALARPAKGKASKRGGALPAASSPRTKKASRTDAEGVATREHLRYCRVKLQKILLRRALKASEIPIAAKIMHVLAAHRVTVNLLKETSIGRVLGLAARRPEFAAGSGVYAHVGEQVRAILAAWKRLVEAYVAEIGLE